MNDINNIQPFCEKLLHANTNIKGSAISTIDHVYASPPIRLLDGHMKLSNLGSFTIVVVDTTMPDTKRNRVDLLVDTCFYTSQNPEYFLFELHKYSFQSSLHTPDFAKIQRNLSFIFDAVEDTNFIDKRLYFERIEKLFNIYKSTLSKATTPSGFYINQLASMYELLGFQALAHDVRKSAVSLWESGIIERYLPDLIEYTKNYKFGYRLLLEKFDIFQAPYFRYVEPFSDNLDLSDRKVVLSNLDYVIELLRKKVILPNVRMYSWGFLLAGIKHFGNDLGFTAAFSEAMDTMGVEHKLLPLQLTVPKGDGNNFIEFSADRSYMICDTPAGFKVVKANKKVSRINTLNAAWLHLGTKTKEFYQQHEELQEPALIHMGNIT